MVTDRKMDPQGNVVKECLSFALGTTATGQTAKRTDAMTVGYPFKIVRVEAYALTVTATISVDVQIGSTSVLASAITPVADTPTAGTLSATPANLIGSATGVLGLKYTSNGTGAATNGFVNVWVRPEPLNGEIAL